MKIILVVSLMALIVFSVACSKGTDSPKIDILTAIDTGKIDIVRQHIITGTNPDKTPIPKGLPFEGAFPLHLAVLKGNQEIAQLLIDNEAKIDIKAENREAATPLHWAAFFNQKDMVSLLIKSGAPINAIDATGSTPLDSAFFAQLITENKAISESLGEIMTIIKSNGGKAAKDL